MPHPLAYTSAWHACEETRERTWLDDWARLHLALEPEPAMAAPVPALTTTGSH